MSESISTVEDQFAEAVAAFWRSRTSQQERQVAAGRVDVGSRGAVTGGGQMEAPHTPNHPALDLSFARFINEIRPSVIRA